MFEHPRTRGGRNQAGRAARIAVRPRDRVGAGLACIVRAPIFLCGRPRCEADGTIVARGSVVVAVPRRVCQALRAPSTTSVWYSSGEIRCSSASASGEPNERARRPEPNGLAFVALAWHLRGCHHTMHSASPAFSLQTCIERQEQADSSATPSCATVAWAVPIWARALSRRRHQSHECWELDSTPAWEERFARAREPSLAANPIIDILVARASQDESPADRGALQTAQQERVQRRPQFLADRVPEGSRCRKRREREAGVGGGSQSKAVLRRLLT